MALPATETISGAMCFTTKPETDGFLSLVNSTGADLAIGDFAVMNDRWCGIAAQAIASTAEGAFEVGEGIIFQTAALHTSANTFATKGQDVFWDASLKKFVDTTATGRFLVGCLSKVKNAAGVIEIEKFRYAVKV